MKDAQTKHKDDGRLLNKGPSDHCIGSEHSREGNMELTQHNKGMMPMVQRPGHSVRVYHDNGDWEEVFHTYKESAQATKGCKENFMDSVVINQFQRLWTGRASRRH